MMTALILNSTVKEIWYNFKFSVERTFVTVVVHQPYIFNVQPAKCGNSMTAIVLLLSTIMGCTRVPNAQRVMSKEIQDDAASKFKAAKKLGPRAYASSQIIQAVEEGKSIDEVLDLAEDVAPEMISL